MRKRQTQDNVIGLTLQLQKFGVGKSPIARYEGKNTVLGHYDGLVIAKITQWLDFSPRMDWESGKKQIDPNDTVTHYPLKLLFPDLEANGEPAGFFYEAWKSPETLLKRNPCMTVVLLNLTDTYKNKVCGELLHEFLKLLTEKREVVPLLEKVHCCVLPSLGYSDFCILMAGVNWKPAFKLVECLHDLTIGNSDMEKIAVLSTDYMMPVFHRGQKKISSHHFKGLELSIRVNLSPGITAQQLADHLPEVQVYRTSGGSDCVLRANKKNGQQQLIDFLLAPGTGDLVIDMASTPQLLVPHEKNNSFVESESTEDIYQEYIIGFKKAVTAYEEGLVKHKRHCRQANSLRELVASVGSICSQSHSGDLRNIMKGLVENFSYCLEQSAHKMDQDGWNFNKMETCISEFTDVVSSFLSDLSRSDCFFMERDRYNHASVSSTTSLLVAYNQWLDGFTNTVSKATDKDNQSTFAFLVTSGGRDQTRTLNAFWFLEPLIQDEVLFERVPLVTQMSEMSLFDFSGTILRSAHECMHFSGARQRTYRVQSMLTFVNITLAQLFASALFPDDRIYHYAEQRLKDLGAKQELQDAVKKSYGECWRELAENILVQLNECFDLSEIKNWNEANRLCRNVKEWIYETLMRAFSGYELLDGGDGNKFFTTNKFAQQLYKLTQQEQRRFFEECNLQCKKHGISTVLFAFGSKRQEVIVEEDQRIKYETDVVLSRQVQIILSRLLITTRPEKMPASVENVSFIQSIDATSEESNRTVWEKSFPYFSLTYSNLYHILRSTEDIFSESFADVVACECLGAVLEDYLLMHVYEDWNIDSALKTDMTTYYRIATVLRLCFPSDLCDNGRRLTDQARNRMDAAIRRLVGHGMPKERLQVEALCDRIDILLMKFAEVQDIGAPLLKYLEKCKDAYAQDAVKEKLKPFKDSFHAIRLISIDPQEQSVHRKLLAMYDALIDRGGKYHNSVAKMS